MTGRADVAVVGGGVIGCAVARELARRGRRVILLERGAPGGEASGVAAGLLSPQADAAGPSPFFDLCLASRRLYPDWARAIEEESGRCVGLRQTGILRCALSPEEEQRLEVRERWQREAGLSLREVDAAGAAALAGLSLSGSLRRALFFPEDGIVDSACLVTALAEAARGAGVEVRAETEVRGFRIEAGRCVGVETERESVAADLTVDAAGAWAAFAGILPVPVPVWPVKGQLLVLGLSVGPLSTVVESEEVYLVPSGDGRVLAGATVERVGFDKTLTPKAAAGLLAAAARLVPAAAAAELREGRAGLRPGTPDGLPLLGPTAIAGLWLAAGHYRNGILLAPISARLLADAADGRSPSELTPFLADRFGRVEPATAKGFG